VSDGPWLVDTSALARLDRPEVVDVLVPRLTAGRVHVSIVTELEIGYSARSTNHY
jgi:predicted nucleic acid-binding protein